MPATLSFEPEHGGWWRPKVEQKFRHHDPAGLCDPFEPPQFEIHQRRGPEGGGHARVFVRHCLSQEFFNLRRGWRYRVVRRRLNRGDRQEQQRRCDN